MSWICSIQTWQSSVAQACGYLRPLQLHLHHSACSISSYICMYVEMSLLSHATCLYFFTPLSSGPVDADGSAAVLTVDSVEAGEADAVIAVDSGPAFHVQHLSTPDEVETAWTALTALEGQSSVRTYPRPHQAHIHRWTRVLFITCASTRPRTHEYPRRIDAHVRNTQ